MTSALCGELFWALLFARVGYINSFNWRFFAVIGHLMLTVELIKNFAENYFESVKALTLFYNDEVITFCG